MEGLNMHSKVACFDVRHRFPTNAYCRFRPNVPGRGGARIIGIFNKLMYTCYNNMVKYNQLSSTVKLSEILLC